MSIISIVFFQNIAQKKIIERDAEIIVLKDIFFPFSAAYSSQVSGCLVKRLKPMTACAGRFTREFAKRNYKGNETGGKETERWC